MSIDDILREAKTVEYDGIKFYVGIWDNEPVQRPDDNPIADYDRSWSDE